MAVCQKICLILFALWTFIDYRFRLILENVMTIKSLDQIDGPAGNRKSRLITHLLTASLATIFAGAAMAAQSQVITIGAFETKTYGDSPFTVTATASSGLPITKWESADPAVATISSSGLVTLVGAGQTSIIASNSGDANYNAAWIAQPLNVARSLASLPSGTQTVTYNGSAQGLTANALPSGQASEITYRDTSVSEAIATPQVVFQNGPDTLALGGYGSTGFAAVGFSGLAKYAGLAGTARKLHSCDVALVSWARYDTSSPNGYKSWADSNPSLVVQPPANSYPGNSGGFYHPVTLAFYTYESDPVTETEKFRLLTTQTVQALIPWRPEKVAEGGANYSFNGYAFRVPFSFSDGIILPQDVWISVSFNTQNYGTAPVGSPGPYNSLNVASPLTQLVGTTQFSTFTLSYKNWRWQNSTSPSGPMLRLRAVPTNATLSAPTNAGTYEINTKAAGFGTDGSSSSTLVINKAPLQINLGNLSQIRDGMPKPVTITTSPLGIATSVSYSGSSTVPSALGSYPVSAGPINPNYQGQAAGTLQIGDNFGSWQTATFAGSGLPADQTASAADPDGDGLSNFLEYASNLNPLVGDNPSPVGFQPNADTLSFTYRRNLNALDLDYSLQNAANLANPTSWAPVTPISETTLSDDGSTRVIRASVAKPPAQPSYFMRLKVSR